jgi:hypothetical protein
MLSTRQGKSNFLTWEFIDFSSTIPNRWQQTKSFPGKIDLFISETNYQISLAFLFCYMIAIVEEYFTDYYPVHSMISFCYSPIWF